MKFNCGPTAEEKEKIDRAQRDKLKVWHRHFAWWPTRVGSHDCRWLEWIERKGTHALDNEWDAYNAAKKKYGEDLLAWKKWVTSPPEPNTARPVFPDEPMPPYRIYFGSLVPPSEWTWEYRASHPSYSWTIR